MKKFKRFFNKNFSLLSLVFIFAFLVWNVGLLAKQNQFPKQNPPAFAPGEVSGPETITGGFYTVSGTEGKYSIVDIHLNISSWHGGVTRGKDFKKKILTSKLTFIMTKCKLKPLKIIPTPVPMDEFDALAGK